MPRSTRTPDRAYEHADDQLRLMARVARMYHQQGITQGLIAERLQISQPRVSRLLKRAVDLGVVRTIVTVPAGVHAALEEELENRYQLDQVVIADAEEADGDVVPALGAATADYLAATLTGGDTVGISSWSASLLACVEAMRPFRQPVVDTVVQLVGGLGDPRVQMRATRLIGQLASYTGAEPMFLSTPAVLDSATARDSLVNDSTVADVLQLWDRLSVALVGIGDVEPSDLIRESGNIIDPEVVSELAADGAVGEICFRFFDGGGELMPTGFSDRIIGISPERFREVPRRVGVAGGARKRAAIRAAVRGGWVNVLVTDLETANALAEPDTD